MVILRENEGYEYKFNDFMDLLMNYFYPFSDFKDELTKKNIHFRSFSKLLAEYRIELHNRTELLNKIYEDSDGIFECPFNCNYTIEVISKV